MPDLIKKADPYQWWVGQQYTCPNNKNQYQISAEDIADLKVIQLGHPLDELTQEAVLCPCGRHVYHDGREFLHT